MNWKPSEVSWVPKLAPALKVFTKSSELLFSWPCWGSGIMNQNPEPAKVKTCRSSPIIALYHRCKSDLEILPQQSYLSRILLWTGKINLYWKFVTINEPLHWFAAWIHIRPQAKNFKWSWIVATTRGLTEVAQIIIMKEFLLVNF